MRPDIKQDFSRFLNAVPGRLHVAAHSHHYWPDVTFDAQTAVWQDAALHADNKWGHIFDTIMPAVRQGLARALNLPDPNTLVFAQNTHEFVVRLLSCLPTNRLVRILTSDSEFHSFDRQIKRLEEENIVTVTRIATQPLDSFAARFTKAAGQDHDMVFVSHVFYNSGFMLDNIDNIIAGVKNDDTLIVIDGYHSFMAIPVDLSRIAHRAFYLGGGYKYAMSGEGACFMHCPPGYGARPRNTGWFAGFGALAAARSNNDAVPFGDDASRFAGATADISGLYRMRAVLEWLQNKNISPADIHTHVHTLQAQFVEGLQDHPLVKPQDLLVPVSDTRRGNFLTFKTPQAGDICVGMKAKNIIADYRGDALRFGFGLYHDLQDIETLTEVLHQHVR